MNRCTPDVYAGIFSEYRDLTVTCCANAGSTKRLRRQDFYLGDFISGYQNPLRIIKSISEEYGRLGRNLHPLPQCSPIVMTLSPVRQTGTTDTVHPH